MKTSLTDVERSLVVKLYNAQFPQGMPARAFVRELANSSAPQVSPEQRGFLALIAHRLRRQCFLSEPEELWIKTHCKAAA